MGQHLSDSGLTASCEQIYSDRTVVPTNLLRWDSSPSPTFQAVEIHCRSPTEKKMFQINLQKKDIPNVTNKTDILNYEQLDCIVDLTQNSVHISLGLFSTNGFA